MDLPSKEITTMLTTAWIFGGKKPDNSKNYVNENRNSVVKHQKGDG